jgi:hypothetical protein
MIGFDAPAFQPPAWLPPDAVAPQGVTTLRWATAGYASRATDTPASTLYEPRLLADVTIGQSASSALGLGGVVALTGGSIAVANGDDALGDLDRYGTADGRAIHLLALPVADRGASDFGTPLAAAPLAFAGLVRGIYRGDRGQGRIDFGDATERLVTPLQPTLYAGTGGLEGPANLTGQPKPVLLGRAFNVEPVYLGNVDIGDGTLATYQVHWRGVQQVDAVRMRGVAQTLVSSAPTTGQARAWVAQGLVQLGSAPDGTVRVDAQGDATPVYVSSTAGVLRRLLSSLGPQLGDSAFDAVSWSITDGDLAGEIGWYRGPVAVTAAQAAQEIVGACGAVLAGGRGGALRIFDPLATAAAQFTLDWPQIIACRPVDLPAALRPLPIATAVTWRPNWSPIADAAGAVSATLRQSLATLGSGPARVIGSATVARQAVQRDLFYRGLYWAQADATARATKWQAFLDAGPRLFQVETDAYPGQVETGHIGRIAWPDYGLAGSAPVVVLGWQEQLGARRLALTCATLPEG